MEGISDSILIPVAGIDEDYPYGLRYHYEDPLLLASLEKKGMLFPILLTPVGGRNILVSGHKRHFHASRKKWEKIPACLIQERFSERELFFFSLYSNWGQNFSELDRMEALRKAEKVFSLSREEILEAVMPAMGMPAHRGILEEYRRVGELAPEIHAHIQRKNLAFRGTSSLGRFSRAEQIFLAQKVFHCMHLTASQLSQLAEWLLDLAKSRKTSLERILDENLLQQTLSNPSLDPRMRGEKFFVLVRSLRYPRISHEEERFRRIRGQFEEEQEIQLGRPEGFESEGLLLRARLKDREGLGRVLSFLARHREKFESFFKEG